MTAYIPKVFCAHCRKQLVYGVDIKRKATGTQRMLEATCHGERHEIEFTDDPDATVELWDASIPVRSSAV